MVFFYIFNRPSCILTESFHHTSRTPRAHLAAHALHVVPHCRKTRKNPGRMKKLEIYVVFVIDVAFVLL